MKTCLFCSATVFLGILSCVGCAHTFVSDVPEGHPASLAVMEAPSPAPSTVLRIHEPKPEPVPPEMMNWEHGGNAEYETRSGTHETTTSFYHEKGADE
jgi:hypothetical protein